MLKIRHRMFPCYFIWRDPKESFANLKKHILKDLKKNNFDNYILEEHHDEKKQLQKHIELLTLELSAHKNKKKNRKIPKKNKILKT